MCVTDYLHALSYRVATQQATANQEQMTMVVGSNITEMNSPSAWDVWCRTRSPGAGQRRCTYVYHEPSFWILELIDTWVTERCGGRLIRRVDNWMKKGQLILVVCHCVVTPSQNSGHNLVADSALAATRLLILWWVQNGISLFHMILLPVPPQLCW